MKQYWTPDRRWEGQDAYVIGGGPSLRTFDWNLIKGRNTVGCNSAYLLGSEVCQVCFFGDINFFRQFEKGLENFKGLVVTNCSRPLAPWLKVMKRLPRGLSTGDTLGWNWNSGAAAVNLALSFGAKRVFLLGIDLINQDGRHNWHDQGPTPPTGSVYLRFMEGFRHVKANLPRVFPGCEVINVSGKDRAGIFPVISVEEHFGVKV